MSFGGSPSARAVRMGGCLCNLKIHTYDSDRKESICPQRSYSASILRAKADVIIAMILVDANARNAILEFTASRNDTLNLLLCGEILNLKALWKQQRISHPAFLRLTKNLLLTIATSKVSLSKGARTLLNDIETRPMKETREESIIQAFLILEQELLDDLVHLLPLFERSRQFADYIRYKSIPCESYRIPISLDLSKSYSDPVLQLSSLQCADKTNCCRRILIVDSTAIISKILICGLLRHFGKVFHAINEVETLDCLLSLRSFDYVLFNFDINDQGGINILRSYKAIAHESSVPFNHFIGMTSDAGSPYINFALNLGFKVNLVMPFNHNDVIDTIQQLKI